MIYKIYLPKYKATEQAGIDELKQIAQLEAQTYVNIYEHTTADNKKVPVPAGFAVIKEEGENVAG